MDLREWDHYDLPGEHMDRTVCEHNHPEEGFGPCLECEAEAEKWHPMAKQIVDLKTRVAELDGTTAIQQAMFNEAMDRAVRAEKRLENIRQLTTTKHETMAQFVSRVRDALYLETR